MLDVQELFRLYGDDVLRMCNVYLRKQSLAEDAFQETMIKCWQRYDTYRGDAPFTAWLKKIAINVCHDTNITSFFK